MSRTCIAIRTTECFSHLGQTVALQHFVLGQVSSACLSACFLTTDARSGSHPKFGLLGSRQFNTFCSLMRFCSRVVVRRALQVLTFVLVLANANDVTAESASLRGPPDSAASATAAAATVKAESRTIQTSEQDDERGAFPLPVGLVKDEESSSRLFRGIEKSHSLARTLSRRWHWMVVNLSRKKIEAGPRGDLFNEDFYAWVSAVDCFCSGTTELLKSEEDLAHKAQVA